MSRRNCHYDGQYRKGKTMPPKEAKIKGEPIGGYPVFTISRKSKPVPFDRSLMCDDVFCDTPRAEDGRRPHTTIPLPSPRKRRGAVHRCPFCEADYDSLGMLQMHVRRCHMEDDPPEDCCADAKVTPYADCPQSVQARSCWPDTHRQLYVECGKCGPHWRYAK